MKKSETFKKHQNKSKGFTIIPNSISYDPRLSIKAFGMLCKLLMLPEDWDFTISGLATQFKDSKDSVSSALKELEGLGYLVREQLRAERGKFGKTCYHVFEEPIDVAKSVEEILADDEKNQEQLDVSPITDFPTTVNPTTGNPPQYNNYSIKELINKKIKNNSPSFSTREEKRDKLALLLNDTCGVEGAKRVSTAISKSYGNMSLSLLEKAIELAIKKDIKDIKKLKGYILTILSDWSCRGFTTVEEVEELLKKIENSKNTKAKKVIREEMKPDWLNQPQQSYDPERKFTPEELEIIEQMKVMGKGFIPVLPSQNLMDDDLPF